MPSHAARRAAPAAVLCVLSLLTSCARESAVTSTAAAIAKTADGVVVPLERKYLKLEVCGDDVIRVACATDPAFFAKRSLMAGVRPASDAHFDVSSTAKAVTVSTAKVKAVVSLPGGAVAFFDHGGKPILAETERTISPAVVQDERTNHVRQVWQPHDDEALYGLGQNQLDLLDLKGYDLDLWQHNTSVAVPFLVSSRGYGILWDNTSLTRFGDLRPFEAIPTAQLFDAEGHLDGLTASYFADGHFGKRVAKRFDPRIDVVVPGDLPGANRLVHPDLPEKGDISVRWEGEVEPATSGEYQFQAFSNGGIKLWIDGKLVFDHWRQAWIPFYDQAKVKLTAGRRVKVRLDWTAEGGREVCQLKWKVPVTDRPATSLWSEVGDGTDYYFVYGPKVEDVIAGYRRVTGRAPMMPAWAMGLWQSRERYKTQQESIDVVKGYRSRNVPFDNIVQDWFYWKEDAWGSHRFDPARFPDPDGWVKAIHDLHAHLMISVWGKFYPGTDNFEAMNRAGYLYQPDLREHVLDWMHYPYTFYDAYNPGARSLFWKQINERLFSKSIDAWWMDASEPELAPISTVPAQQTHMNPTALGTGARMLNAWSLVNSQGIYEGQRAAAPDQRVFILTRSGFAGQQRYAAATWSGDITCTWTALRKQIPAGLSFAMSGLPWWTTDSGGFAPPARFARKDASPADLDEWRELNVRWFQFAAFCPLMRVHGEYPYREFWEFGGDDSPAYRAMVKMDRVRYRLLPYVYSVAGGVTRRDGMILRPLVVDWPGDAVAREVKDEFMYGPALLVAPVIEYKARSRKVYLPAGTWYDFWTGAKVDGGRTIEARAEYDSVPVFVRAGAVVPTGPDVRYCMEKPADPLTLHVYPGASGEFTVYEDDGVSYGYERGGFAEVPVTWDEARGVLTIGERRGGFRGMLEKRTIRVVKGKGMDGAADQSVTYTGQGVEVKLR